MMLSVPKLSWEDRGRIRVGSTIHMRDAAIKPHASIVWQHCDREHAPGGQESGHIPFSERVELMIRHCGLSRAEAEAEAAKWLVWPAQPAIS